MTNNYMKITQSIGKRESVEAIEPFIREIARQVQAEILISDDFDTYKYIADNADLKHQICQNPIIRNVDKSVETSENRRE
jgi:hypothetical protein